MKRYLIIVGVLLCVNANANQTPYEVLKSAFENANEAASLEDFDEYSDKGSNQRCAMAAMDYYSAETTMMKKYAVVIPATPARGPLFPGEPEKKKYGFVTYYYNGNDLEEILDGIVLSETWEQSGNELLINIPQIGGFKDSPFEVRIKKNEKTVYFSMKTNFGAEGETLYYGYCWRE